MKVHSNVVDTKVDKGNVRNATIRNKPSFRADQQNKKLLLLKAAVLSCIMVAASLVGYASYEVVRDYEYSQFEHSYKALMDQLIPSTHAGNEDCVTYCTETLGTLTFTLFTSLTNFYRHPEHCSSGEYCHKSDIRLLPQQHDVAKRCVRTFPYSRQELNVSNGLLL
jgi:hypothetical protein